MAAATLMSALTIESLSSSAESIVWPSKDTLAESRKSDNVPDATLLAFKFVRLEPSLEHVRFPFAAIALAKEPATQSVGFATKAVAVSALPCKLPMKVGAVTLLVKFGVASLYLATLVLSLASDRAPEDILEALVK